jgi:hypothetical protein
MGLAPLTPAVARARLVEGRRAALLTDFRGTAPVDESALPDIIVGVGDLLVDHPQIVELDLNPRSRQAAARGRGRARPGEPREHGSREGVRWNLRDGT